MSYGTFLSFQSYFFAKTAPVFLLRRVALAWPGRMRAVCRVVSEVLHCYLVMPTDIGEGFLSTLCLGEDGETSRLGVGEELFSRV